MCWVVLPAWKQEEQKSPIRKSVAFAQCTKRLCRRPSAGYSPQPDAILPSAIEPNYGGCEYLLYRPHVSIVRPPRFHVLGMHGVDHIIVASRPNRVVILPRRIVDEQTTQLVSINDPPQLNMEF